MSKKNVLIAYGTRYGSAGIVAGEIASSLGQAGHECTVVNLRSEKVPSSLSDYHLIVAGSSVAMFSWVGKVKSFLRRCAKKGAKTVVYITCGTAIEDVEKARERFFDKVLRRVGLSPVLSLITGPVIDFRPGEGLSPKIKGRIKATIQAMIKDDYKEDGLMDMRDIPAFKTFLGELKDLLED